MNSQPPDTSPGARREPLCVLVLMQTSASIACRFAESTASLTKLDAALRCVNRLLGRLQYHLRYFPNADPINIGVFACHWDDTGPHLQPLLGGNVSSDHLV